MSAHSDLRKALELRRAVILRRVGRIEQDLRSPRAADWVEQATELENDEVLEGLDEMSRDELRQITDAVRRIDQGTYGVCVVCHQPIDDARLRALPTTSTCIRCAG